MLSNTLRVNFFFLKITHILYPHYHPKILRHALKSKKEQVCLYSGDFVVNQKENEDENKK